MTIEAFIIIILLLVVQVITVLMSRYERKELIDRIMAKSYVEYKDNDKLEENDFGKEDPNIINLDEAKEELNG